MSLKNYFREWQAIKDKRFLAFDENGVKSRDFNVFRDSLFDYPTIINHKMEGSSWKMYNYLLAIHVPACTYNCWHCYVMDESKNPQKMQGNGLFETFFC